MLSFKNETFERINKEKRFDAKYFFLEDNLKKYTENPKLEVLKLGDKSLLKKITDGEHAGQKFVDEGILFIKNSSVKNFHISRFDGFYIEEWKHKEQKRSALKKGDILFTTIGHLGSSAIVPIDLGEANINQNLVKMEINQEILNPYYLVTYLNSKLVKSQIESMFTGNIHGILTYPKIKNLTIIFPKDEKLQNEISQYVIEAEKLDSQSLKLINKAKNLFLERLDVDFNSIVGEKSFNIQINELNNSEKLWIPKYFYPKYVKALNLIKGKHETLKLGDITNIISGNEAGSQNYSTYFDKNPTDVPFIRTSDIFNNELDMYPDNYIPIEIFSELKQDIQKGDLIFSKDGKIGLTAMVSGEEKVVLSSGLTRIRVDENIDTHITNEYIYTALSIEAIGQFQANQRTVFAATIPHLRLERLKSIEIPILDEKSVDEITDIMRTAFEMKDKKNTLLKSAVDRLEIILAS